MWLNHSRGRAWDCSQCKAKQGLRSLRGNCGGSFKRGLPQSQVDDDGHVYIMGYRVAPDSGESFSDLEIRSCPVALSNRVAPIVQAYHRHRSGLLTIAQSYPKPTCAIIEALEVLHYNHEDAQYRAQKTAMMEASKNV